MITIHHYFFLQEKSSWYLESIRQKWKKIVVQKDKGYTICAMFWLWNQKWKTWMTGWKLFCSVLGTRSSMDVTTNVGQVSTFENYSWYWCGIFPEKSIPAWCCCWNFVHTRMLPVLDLSLNFHTSPVLVSRSKADIWLVCGRYIRYWDQYSSGIKLVLHQVPTKQVLVQDWYDL